MQLIRKDGTAPPLLTGGLIGLSAYLLLEKLMTKPPPVPPIPRPPPPKHPSPEERVGLTQQAVLTQGGEADTRPNPPPGGIWPLPRPRKLEVGWVLLGVAVGVVIGQLSSMFQLPSLEAGNDANQGLLS